MATKFSLNELLLSIEINWCDLGYEIDDLGDFNKRTMTFIEPITNLKNRYGEKYSEDLHQIIKQARKDFIEIHKITMPMNFEDDEDTLLFITDYEKDDLLNSAKILRRFGWTWRRVADTLNISKSYLYNELHFKEFEQNTPIVFKKLNLDEEDLVEKNFFQAHEDQTKTNYSGLPRTGITLFYGFQ